MSPSIMPIQPPATPSQARKKAGIASSARSCNAMIKWALRLKALSVSRPRIGSRTRCPTSTMFTRGNPGPIVSYLESGAIDQKCVGCHSDFHNETVANSTWIRHPVDVAIPDAGEFTGFDVYNPMVPVARQNVSLSDVNFSSINRGSDVVSCISCHRPHGSPYPAMLRWGYRDWPGTDSHTLQPAFNGCAVCHTSKD